MQTLALGLVVLIFGIVSASAGTAGTAVNDDMMKAASKELCWESEGAMTEVCTK